MTHLWEMKTMWFEKPTNDHINSTFPYKSWKDFTEYKPHKLWKPYILSSWSWKKCTIDEVDPNKKHRDQQNYIVDCSSMNISQYNKDLLEKGKYNTDVQMLQIVFISPDRFSGLHRVEIRVQEEDEESIRAWLTSHMPTFWKL